MLDPKPEVTPHEVARMIVCHCNALNDRAIRAAVCAGARDADEVAERCGAGGDCGGCFEAIEHLVEAALRGQAPVAA
jgi:bacterioferritin-associated ferredoxin